MGRFWFFSWKIQTENDIQWFDIEILNCLINFIWPTKCRHQQNEIFFSCCFTHGCVGTPIYSVHTPDQTNFHQVMHEHFAYARLHFKKSSSHFNQIFKLMIKRNLTKFYMYMITSFKTKNAIRQCMVPILSRQCDFIFIFFYFSRKLVLNTTE